jgi:hypothetical protein
MDVSWTPKEEIPAVWYSEYSLEWLNTQNIGCTGRQKLRRVGETAV